LQCYLKLGRQVGPETPQCQPRRLRSHPYIPEARRLGQFLEKRKKRFLCKKRCAKPYHNPSLRCMNRCLGIERLPSWVTLPQPRRL
jgi:hypothetical protein